MRRHPIADRRRRPALEPLEARALRAGTVGDFDGDGRADPAVYHFDGTTNEGVFEIRLGDGSTRVERIADLSRGDVPVGGDFDGDGKADLAVVRPEADLDGDGHPDATVWVIRRSSDGAEVRIPFGAPGALDRPAPADYDGDGKADLATFRASSDLTPGAAEWFVLSSGGGPAFRVAFGAAGGQDLPAPADYDGDGEADLATYRPESDLTPGAAEWFVLPSGPNDPSFRGRRGGFAVTFGAGGTTDAPAPADLNGDGRADLVAFRSVSDLSPGSAEWFVLPTAGASPSFGGGYAVTFGAAGSIAATADYDGDGRPDLAAFDPSTGLFAIAPIGPDGRPAPGGGAAAFDPGGGRVPVLAPLPFRLPATAPEPTPPPPPTPPASIPVYDARIVAAYPHDTAAFTEGLAIAGGVLYEGTGLVGRSQLRQVDLATGRVVRRVDLPASLFGEGVTVLGDRIYQLTWTSGVGFIYDRSTFARIGTFRYTGEGWGLTNDGRDLILSDGTSTLRYLDPATFAVVRSVAVAADGSPVDQLNELEFIDGQVYANVWKTDRIARIDPATGAVVGWVDLSGLPRPTGNPEAVANGIALDPATGRLYVTGKDWSDLFEVRLVPRG